MFKAGLGVLYHHPDSWADDFSGRTSLAKPLLASFTTRTEQRRQCSAAAETAASPLPPPGKRYRGEWEAVTVRRGYPPSLILC